MPKKMYPLVHCDHKWYQPERQKNSAKRKHTKLQKHKNSCKSDFVKWKHKYWSHYNLLWQVVHLVLIGKPREVKAKV